MRHDAGNPKLHHVAVILLLFAGASARAVEAIPPPAPRPSDAGRKPDANDGRCDVCGGGDCVRTVCVPKPKEREIKKTCWSFKCETVCIPGPSRHCGRKRGEPDDCGCWSYDAWKPTCAGIVTKKVPVKTEVKRTVPGIEWKPEERCTACRCRSAVAPPETP